LTDEVVLAATLVAPCPPSLAESLEAPQPKAGLKNARPAIRANRRMILARCNSLAMALRAADRVGQRRPCKQRVDTDDRSEKQSVRGRAAVAHLPLVRRRRSRWTRCRREITPFPRGLALAHTVGRAAFPLEPREVLE